jgi:hypothetical protein
MWTIVVLSIVNVAGCQGNVHHKGRKMSDNNHNNKLLDFCFTVLNP